MWCYTLVSCALIGIPPTCGFISKWFLAEGALAMNIAANWAGPCVLLISAVLTAGYLLPITIRGFFPGADFNHDTLVKAEPNWLMTLPLILLAAGAVLLGMFPGALSDFLQTIINAVL
jgi:multicomponent Na+:H+ antiporter subunit D